MTTLRIACLQSGGVLDDPRANLDELDEALGRAAARDASLLVVPELFLTGYDIGERVHRWADEPLLEEAARLAAEHRMHLIAGLPRRIDGEVYNCAAVIGAGGEVAACYAKSHLFGELDRRWFAAGEAPFALVEIEGVRVAVMICYDVEFPETVRAAALAGAQLVAVPTAQMEPFAFVATTVIPARAWENQLYLAYVNRIGSERDTRYVGRSGIIGPDGRSLAEAGAQDRELLFATVDTGTVERAQRENPYLADRRPALYPAGGEADG